MLASVTYRRRFSKYWWS